MSVDRSVTIYTRMLCPYCSQAINLLKSKQVTFNEIDAGFSPSKREEMIERSNGNSTFPQIFVGNQHIGGFDDLALLERQGKLDKLLFGEAC